MRMAWVLKLQRRKLEHLGDFYIWETSTENTERGWSANKLPNLRLCAVLAI